MSTAASGANGADDPKPADPHQAAALTAELRELVEQANQGEPLASERLRRFLDAHPEIWERCGDVSRYAERSWLRLLAGEALGGEAIPRHLDRMRAELLGEHPTRVERLLADQVVVCFLAAQHAEITAADPAPVPLGQAALRLKRAESAQRRYLAALRTLTHLRAKLPEGLSPLNSLRLFTGESKRRTQA
jgi:hypothetical protein